MLSATPMPTDGAALEAQPSQLDVDSQSLLDDVPSELNSLEATAPGDSTFELVFVDKQLRDYHLLLDGLVENQPGRDFEIILLEAGENGIEQIGDELSRFEEVDAIHILSHGSQQGLQLGNAWLRAENLEDHAEALSLWGESLSADADLLFYGCELAGSDAGQSLLSSLQDLTGADVAASTNNTGHTAYGGDWQLEFTDGTIETAIAINGEAQDAWDRLMATVNVTTTEDIVNGDTISVAALIANPGLDGISLREAILATNADTGADTINLMAGVYTLTIAGDLEDAAATGDLDITDDVTIVGDAAHSTYIDGGGIDRVLHVISNSASLSNLTIRGGDNASDGMGGGIYNQATLVMADVIVRDNVSSGQGGGVYDDGLTFIQHSAIINNQAQDGAGLYHSPTSASSLTVVVSTISGNTATGSGGGLYDGNAANLNAVTIAYNSAADGGGIHTTGTGTTIYNTLVANNSAGVGADVSGLIQSSGTNLIGVSAGGSGYDVSDIRDVDARLDPVLTANVGSTPAHQLLVSSPAVDTASLTGTPMVDQSHQTRLIDGDGDTTDEVDIGAVEYRPLDPNSPPQDISLSNSSVSDGTDTTGGFSVGTLLAFDPDVPESFSYLVVGGADEASFWIGGLGADELMLDDGVLDVGNQPSYDVMVRVTDSEGNYYEETLTIDVISMNSPPSVRLENTISVAEDLDTTSSVKVADIVVSDDGVGINMLSLTGNDEALFVIVGNSELHIRSGVQLDYELQQSLDVTVEVDDVLVGGNPDDSATHSFSVNDVNEAPSVSLTNLVVSLAEDTDTTNSVKVADIIVADDALGTNTLSLSDDNRFEIVNGNELHLKTGTVLDFESEPFFDITVEVNDATVGGDPDDADSHRLDITDVNEAPTLSLTYVVTSLPEDTNTSDSIKIADIEIEDDALGTNVLQLTDDSIFVIVNNTELHLKAGTVLDFESASSLTVTLELDDSQVGTTPDDSELVAVTITDVNEPATVALINLIPITENTDTSNSVKVGDIDVNDDLLGTNTLSLSGNDASVFIIINSNELHLRAGTTLDYEVQSSYEVTIAVDDLDVGGTPDDFVDFTLTLVDENEAPSMASAASVSVDENTTDVVVVSANDPENDSLLYSITGGLDEDLFTVDQISGLVSFDPPPDYEVPTDSDGDNVYHVEITATDDQGLTATQQLTVGVDPVNDSLPVFVSNSTAVIIAGNTDVLIVQATDDDLPASAVTYAIAGGPDDGAFQLNSMTGELQFSFVPSANFPQDADGDNIYEVVVRADDNQGGSAFQLIRVLVRPDPPPVVTDDLYVVGNDGTLIVDAATGVLADDYDPDGKPLQAHVHQQPVHGTLVFRSDGAFVYVPDINFVGDDVFTYLARDEQGNVTIGTVTIEVTASSGPSLEDDENDSDGNAPTEVTPGASDPLPDAAPIEGLRDEQSAATSSILRPESIDPITSLQPIELVQLTRSVTPTASYLYAKSAESPNSVHGRSDYDLNHFATYTSLTSTADAWEDMLIGRGLPLDLSIRDVSAGSAAAYVLGGAGVGYYLFWLIRSGSIMSTLMTPAWSIMDPLPVLNCIGDLPRNDDDETLESLISKSSVVED